MGFPFVKQRARANYQLTPLGETKAEQFNMSGARGIVVGALQDCQPATIAEIAKQAKLSPEKVNRVLTSLMGDGWVMKRAEI